MNINKFLASLISTGEEQAVRLAYTFLKQGKESLTAVNFLIHHKEWRLAWADIHDICLMRRNKEDTLTQVRIIKISL